MTKEEALELLKTAPRSSKPSRLNPALTEAQGVDIVEKAIVGRPDGSKLEALFEKRVYQVTRNQKRPRY